MVTVNKFGLNSIIYSTVITGIMVVIGFKLIGIIASVCIVFFYVYKIVMSTTIIIVNLDTIELFPFRQYQYKRVVEKRVLDKIVLHHSISDYEGVTDDEDHVLLVTENETYRYNLDLRRFEMRELYQVLIELNYKVELTGSGTYNWH